MGEIYLETMAREQYLKDRGYNLVVKWAHDWTEEKKQQVEIRDFAKTVSFQQPLNPRDGFFGGRVNALKLHHKVTGNQKIKYMDVTSE